MYKLIAQTMLSLFVSLAVVAGVNPHVRGKVGQVWQETKAAIHQSAALAAAADLNSQTAVNTDTNANVNADANAGVLLGNDAAKVSTGVDANAETELSTDMDAKDGIHLDLDGDTETDLTINLWFWK